MSVRIVLVHGAATTPAVWDRMLPALRRRGIDDIEAVARPCSGDLDIELAFLAARAEGAFVVGQSGGATLALALASSDVPLIGAICHEPAVGSLVPGLLAPLAEAFSQGGVRAFGSRLYGRSWSMADAGADLDAVARDLPMFRRFEPAPSRQRPGSVLVTTGRLSPAVRHEAARLLHARLGYPIETLDGTGHFVARDAPDAFAELIVAHATRALD